MLQARTVLRHKAVVIPRINMNNMNNIKYIVVKDTENKELTFILGGCKQCENIRQCGIRELQEETRGVLINNRGEPLVNEDNLVYSKSLSFKSLNRSRKEREKDVRERVKVSMLYHVFYVDLNISQDQFEYMQLSFLKKKTQTDQETSNIFMLTKPNLGKQNMWRFMRENILVFLEVNNRKWKKSRLPPQ